jgi:hypothetical protein
MRLEAINQKHVSQNYKKGDAKIIVKGKHGGIMLLNLCLHASRLTI